MTEYEYFTDNPDMMWRYRIDETDGWVSTPGCDWIPAFTPKELWLTNESSRYSETELPEWVIQ